MYRRRHDFLPTKPVYFDGAGNDLLIAKNGLTQQLNIQVSNFAPFFGEGKGLTNIMFVQLWQNYVEGCSDTFQKLEKLFDRDFILLINVAHGRIQLA